MNTIQHRAEIPLELGGQRLDQALAEMFPDYSRSRLAQWIKAGDVRVDGATAAPRLRVRGGEQVVIGAELQPEVAMRPEPMDLDIRHEDADLIVLVKPAGLVVHPGAGNPDGTLLNALLHHDPALANLPRAGIVHRLDKDTSGLMVVARSLAAHTALVAMLSRHDVERQYEAVVKGALIAGDTVDAPLGRHARDRLRQAVRDEDSGRHAVTHYRLRERYRAHSLIQCNLETGRTHQIRVHMAHAGHALVGDPLYGGHLKLPKGATERLVATLREFQRQALHAERLAFTHPVSGEAMAFEAQRPADMQELIEALREDAAAN
ncbi:MAG TPA: 23S rRNA pseudouridine(1911/1915/1917) synthase RluD [Rhodanobacteraceae bacterium]|nr:23S rRNA pseudouridine(1911/1915/1917) synthase RluD [Rhodanobacteraceae bacterium]